MMECKTGSRVSALTSDTPKAQPDQGKFLGTVPWSPGVIKLPPVRTVIYITWSPVHAMTSKDDVMISVHVDCFVYYYSEVRNITDIRTTYYLNLALMAAAKFYQGGKVLRPLGADHFYLSINP